MNVHFLIQNLTRGGAADLNDEESRARNARLAKMQEWRLGSPKKLLF